MKWKQRIAVALITAMIAGEASPPMMTMADTGNGSEAASNQIVLANANTKQAAPVFIAKNSAAASAIAHAADGYAGDIELVTGVKPAVSQIASFTGETEQQEVNYALASNEGTITLEAARKGEGELSVLLDGQYPSKKDNSGRWRYSIGTKNTANEENAFKLTIKLKEKIKLTHVDIVGQQNYNKQAEHVDTVDINSTVISYATAPVIIQYKVDDDWLSGTQMTGNANIWNRWTPDANASIITDEVRLVYDGSQVADGYVRFSEIEVWGTPVTDSSETEVPSADTAIIAGTLADDDTLIQSLIKNNKLDTKQLDEIRGGWERYNIQVVDNPTDTIKKAVVVVGSDRRGAVYGLYHISQDLCGVSPWTYWGDVVTQQMDELAFSAGDLQTTSDTPSVKYRGIFLNDEAPSLTSWVEKFGGYNEDFYDHVYELILRLKGNYLWPAMWANVFSTDGKSDPLANAEHADAYGVVMGTSHHEPLFRAGEEWTREKQTYLKKADITYTDAQNNSDKYWDFTKWGNAIKLFWQDGVKRNKAFDNIITLGMRGEADSALEGTTEQNIANLVNVIEAQNEILKEENAYDQPQVLTLYKEVEEYWHKGLKEKLKGVLKQDATIMLCEDNHGNLSTLPTTDDRSYFNNWGMYYHFDYHGGPRSYEWIDTVPLTKVWNNMTMAYDYGVQNIWIVNVGDLKPMELPISYFLDMAYDFDQWGTGNPNSTQTYTEQWVNQQFGNSGLGEEELKDVAQILSDYTRINSRHKPEIVAYDTYSLTNYNEAQRVLDEAIKLEERATAYLEKLRELDSYNGTKYADSYYQLVYYPAAATANVNQMEIFSGLNIRYANWRSVAANTYAELVKVCIQKDKDLQDYYNNTMSDGKWKGMMSSLHVGYTQWDSSNSAYPTAKYVTPVEGSKMIVDVDGSDTCAEKTGDLTLPDFTSTGKEAYAVTISNGGNQTLEYEVKRSADWIQVETGAGSLQTARTLTVSVDWANEELTQKLAADKKASGTIEITSDGKTVRITVNAVSSNVDTQEENVFTASNGAIAIEANHFASKDDRWYELENYGKTGSSMKVYPTTSSFASGEGPSLTYKVYAETEGDYTLTTFVGPSNPINYITDASSKFSGDLHFGLKVNDGGVTTVNALVSSLDEKGEESGDYITGNTTYNYTGWSSSINNSGRKIARPIHLKQGVNEITIYAMEPGLLVERLVVSQVDLKTSYMGPQETWYTGKESKQQELVHYQLEENLVLPGTIQAVYGQEEGNTEENLLNAVEGTNYAYPVVIASDGSYSFTVTGSADDDSATVTISIGGINVGSFALTGEETTVTAAEAVSLSQGSAEVVLTVDGSAKIRSIYAESVSASEGRPATVLYSSVAEGSSAEYAYDQHMSTVWKPDASDYQSPIIGLDFGEKVYVDNFTLNGNFNSVTSYEVQVSDDGEDWSTVYKGDQPDSGKTVYIQGTTAYSGEQWRVVFHSVDSTFSLMEMAFNTYINWALEDTGTTTMVPTNQSSYRDGCLIDGDRMSDENSTSGMWYADNASTSDRNYAVLTFSEPHTLTGINILALQDSKPYSIPDDALTSSNVRKKYTVYNKAEDGSWTQIAALDTSLDQKVLSRITFDQEVTTQEIKVEVTTTYALRLTEIEPIESRTYTVNDVKKVEKETEIDVESLTNYALAANGGTIKASQTYDGKADYCIDGEISGNKDENGKQRRWRINNKEASLTIELAEEREIYCVDLISQQKDLTAGESQYQEPTLETITDLGIKKATISYQTASSSNWESYATLDSDGTKVWNRFKVKKPVRAKAFKIDFPKDAGNKSYVRVIEVQILGTEIKDPDDETTDNDSSGSNEETKLYNLKIQNGYLVKVNDTDMDEAESAEVKEKDHIIAESMEPGEDEEFKEWRVLLGSPDIKIASGSNASRVEFDMPAEDVTLQAEYQKKDTGETDTTTPSTPEVDFTSDPTGWAYAEDAALKKLLENDDILTSADQDILNAGGDISIILNLKRTDISSSDALGRKLLEIWSDEDDKQIAFLGQNRLTKTRPVTEKSRSNLASRANAKRRSSTETVELTGVTQEVEIIAGIPDKWQGMDQNDYQLILYSKDENEEYQLLLQNFEWVTDRTIRFTADVNADYMMMVPVFYTVTFKDYDGTVLGTCKVKAGEAAEAPSKIPEREGYVFTGWNKEYSQVTKDLTVTAKYRRSELVKGVADTLKNILAALEDLGGSLMEMQSEIAYQLKRIQALDMKAHIEKSEIQSLLDEIETVVEGLTGDTIYVENLTGIIDDMQASWALFSVACGEGGRLQVTRTQTPSETPASAGTLGTKLAFKIRLFEGQNLKTDLKTWMKLTMTVPDGLDEDDDLVVIFYPDGSTTGKVLSCDISSGEITMMLKQCGTIVVADKGRKADEEETEDPEMSETPDISEEPETPDTTEETPDTTEETTEQPETTETPDTVEEPETTDTTETTEKTETTKNNRYSSDDDDDDDDDISSGLSSGRRTSSVQEVSGSWKQDEKGWWFAKKTGSYCKSEWAQINGSWYHFDSDGYAETGWCLDNGKWYYLGSSCAMQTGWLTDSLDGNRYYLDPVTGEMIVGWIQIDGKWYYFEENTPSASGWTWNETGKCWQYQQNGSHPRGAYVEGKTR